MRECNLLPLAHTLVDSSGLFFRHLAKKFLFSHPVTVVTEGKVPTGVL